MTSLFPVPDNPVRGVFVAERMRRIADHADVKAVVPIPEARVTRMLRIDAPSEQSRYGNIEVTYPRYRAIPKTGMYLAPCAMRRAMRSATARIVASGWMPDVIDTHYFYPDAVAAAAVARDLDRPLFVSARGTDINRLPDFPGLRRAILKTAAQAAGVIAVSGALRDRMLELGIDGRKIRVLRNGVDTGFFKPLDRGLARTETRVCGPVVLSVGNLVPEKGHRHVIAALVHAREVTLLLVGTGSERESLEKLSASLGVADRVRFLGRRNADELRVLYNAADLLLHPSLREGMPNVVLEAIACGLPVLATATGGVPEVIEPGVNGQIIDSLESRLLADQIERELEGQYDRNAIARGAVALAWEPTIDAQLSLYAQAEGR